MKVSATKVLIICLIVGIVSILIIFVNNIGKGALTDLFSAANERLESEYSISKEDSSLFSDKALSSIKVDEIFKSKKRNPIGFYIVDSLYGLITYQIDSFHVNSLKSALGIQLKSVDRTVGVSYNVMENSSLKFQYKGGGVVTGGKLLITLAGDSLANIYSNDSLLYYRVLFKNFSLKYSEDTPIDIFVEENLSLFEGDLIPTEIMFLKRDERVFLLILHSFEVKDIIPREYLIDMLR